MTALILSSALNNFLGGVFMALTDAYGLSLESVQVLGLLWGVLSTGFIAGGLLVARSGLGQNPVRLLLAVNLVLWTVTLLFPLRSSIAAGGRLRCPLWSLRVGVCAAYPPADTRQPALHPWPAGDVGHVAPA